jgi:hypothetical protein
VPRLLWIRAPHQNLALRSACPMRPMWTIYSYLITISHFMRALFPREYGQVMGHMGFMGHRPSFWMSFDEQCRRGRHPVGHDVALQINQFG